MNNKIKKLTVLESTNHHLDYKALQVYDKPLDEKFVKLRKYVEGFLVFDPTNDPQIIFDVLSWVSQQWKHDGYNDPGKEITSLEILKRAHSGEQFRCVEYGKVASDILSSYGITSRSVGLKTENFDYGGSGMGHVATEVWSNGVGKWIFIDPQFSAYFKHGDFPLNFYELYNFWSNNQFESLELIIDEFALKQIDMSEKAFKKGYIDFITKYFGYVQTSFSGQNFEYSVTLMLEGMREAMTFQGIALENVAYTSKVDDLYFSLNQSIMTFTYTTKKDFMKIIEENNIKSEKDYLENMYKFASEPNLKVKCNHNTPRFDYFEYSFDMENWNIAVDDSFDWHIAEGVHEVYVRTVNQQGLKGIISSMKVEYR
ncbi:hypothetical protein RJG79_07390 [Mycoplasmatota bacterium WC44]